MKQIVCLFLLASLLMGCGRNSGTIEHKIKYTTEAVGLKAGTVEPDGYYTTLGDYITSITPRYFGARLSVMMYQDQWQQEGTHMISYIDGHDNDPNFVNILLVDFSNNEENSYFPILYGDLFDGLFRQKEVTFNYFFLVPDYFEQEFEVPAGYAGVDIMGQNGTDYIDPQTGKRWFKDCQLLPESIYGYPYQQPYGYYFGNTDSTYVVNKECLDLPPSEDMPTGGNHCIIRSNHFAPITVTMPDNGETIEMYSTISFITDNLIQVYAGRDNTPYTEDDVFTYAPNYWERLKVRLEVR